MRDLIARLEAATGPDRQLDALILAAMVGGSVEQSPINGNWCVYVGTDRHNRPRLWEPKSAAERAWWMKKDFTASLDAALSLVPEEWAVEHIDIWPGVSSGVRLLGTHESRGHRWHSPVDGEAVAEAATPALALCIAALRAREAADA